MNKVVGGAAVLLVIAGVLASMHAPAHDETRAPAQHDSSTQDSPARELKKEKTEAKPENLEQKLKSESARVGKVSENPAEDRKRLKEWALSFSVADLQQIKTLVLDQDADADTRFLGVFLMSDSELPEAVSLLSDIALAPVTGQDRQLNFETTIRMQAIDGIINNPHKEITVPALKNIQKKTDQSLFADRTQRGLLTIDGKVPSPADQETAALKKLIKN
jgi:hypothetical protein